MNQTSNQTPRTDALALAAFGGLVPHGPIWKLARTLERELADARDLLGSCQGLFDDMSYGIKENGVGNEKFGNRAARMAIKIKAALTGGAS